MVFKCKMCGGDLEIREGMTVGECAYCGSLQTLPRLDDEKKANLYDRANHFRRNNEFDKAIGIYEKILNEDRTDAEAYWSLVLCRYGIEYVEDPDTHKRIPTVNRTQFTSIYADEDYKSALANADNRQRSLYEAEAKHIDELQRQILLISQKEEPFDVFICYKETDRNGRRTPDSVLANELYHQLVQEGFKVFFSRITLEDKLGSAYEPYIFAALNSAKVMVVLGTKAEYFNAVWVKNEWSRYLSLIKNGAKKMLIPAYKDMDPYDLPEEFSHLQAQDMSRLGFMQDLIRGIKKVAQTEASAASASQMNNATSSMNALLDRGTMALEDGTWEKAHEYFDQVLNMDAHCGAAYLGQLLAANQVPNIHAFVRKRLRGDKPCGKTCLEACPVDEDFIVKTVSQYKVPGFLEAYKLRSMLENFDLTYSSLKEGRAAHLEQEQSYLKTDTLVARTRQFLTGDAKREFENAISEIPDTLAKRVAEEEKNDAAAAAKITEEYREFLRKTAEKIESLSEKAQKERQSLYETAVEAMESAEDFVDYRAAAEKFMPVIDYLDAEERAARCRVKAKDLEKEWDAKQQKKKTMKMVGIVAVVVVVLAVVCTILAIITNKQEQEIRQSLTGQTFSGTYRYGGSYSSYSCTEEIMVKFVNEENCTVTVVRTTKSGSKKESNTYIDSNVPYAIGGGFPNSTLTWESYTVKNFPAEPFEVVIEDGKVEKLTTDNWNSHVGVTLY